MLLLKKELKNLEEIVDSLSDVISNSAPTEVGVDPEKLSAKLKKIKNIIQRYLSYSKVNMKTLSKNLTKYHLLKTKEKNMQ